MFVLKDILEEEDRSVFFFYYPVMGFMNAVADAHYLIGAQYHYIDGEPIGDELWFIDRDDGTAYAPVPINGARCYLMPIVCRDKDLALEIALKADRA